MIIVFIVMGITAFLGLFIFLLIVKQDMDSDYREYDRKLHLKHIERMDKEIK